MTVEDIFLKARVPIMYLMNGACDVKEYQSVTNEQTHVTTHTMVTIYTNQPCRLTYKTNPATEEGEAPKVLLGVRLFLPVALSIKAGCIFVVTQAGKTRTFKAASEPAVYTNHQEVAVESADDYA